jgi:hypothetical protein
MLARDTPSYGLYFVTYHWMLAGLMNLLCGLSVQVCSEGLA